MLAEGFLTAIVYKDRKQTQTYKPHKCQIKQGEKEAWKNQLIETTANEVFAIESEKQNKKIVQGSKIEHNKDLPQEKPTEELPAKEPKQVPVKETPSRALCIPGREQSDDEELDLYTSWSCQNIYQNYPDLHIGGDHIADHMCDSGCIMDQVYDDGPHLLSKDIPLGRSPLVEPLVKHSAPKLLSGAEAGEKSMLILYNQPLSNSVLNGYMERKVEELYKQFFEDHLVRCGSITNLLASSSIMNNLNHISLQLSQEQNTDPSKAREVLLHSLALFSLHNAASGNSSEFSTPDLQISIPLCKKKKDSGVQLT
uniref:Uncharacterized protein n=1 Tax=Sphenodon punctatus TaxID=8508 RepID=A0A8D0GMH8_SPHPU